MFGRHFGIQTGLTATLPLSGATVAFWGYAIHGIQSDANGDVREVLADRAPEVRVCTVELGR